MLSLVAGPAPFEAGVRPAAAQSSWNPWNRDERYQGMERRPRVRVLPDQRYQPPSGIPFFGWGRQNQYQYEIDEPPQRRPQRQAAPPVESTRAPPPKKPDVDPGKTVLVLGDSMADWLAYGLEDAFADASEFGVTRKHRAGSSLIRNEPRDYDWVQGAREALAGEKVDFVVMMVGLGDRHAIRERPPAKPQSPPPGQPLSIKPGDPPSSEQPSIVAPEAERAGPAISHEFRSEKWVELYSKRVDDVAAVLKGRRVPVLWVGLPPIRGPKSRADLSFINDIYRARADKLGAVYVDVWEGFVDESGDFSTYGPDVMGQVRRLRTGDGVHFTKAGARKLAHFVDREIRRLLSRETPVALPVPSEQPVPSVPAAPSGPAPRALAGPVVPLTGVAPAPAPEGLLGSRAQDARMPDPMAIKVLVNGEPVEPAAGRADNFAWPRQNVMGENDIVLPSAEAAAAPARPAQQPGRAVAPRPGQRPAAPPAATPARPAGNRAAATPALPVR